jgi:hypothetical protein
LAQRRVGHALSALRQNRPGPLRLGPLPDGLPWVDNRGHTPPDGPNPRYAIETGRRLPRYFFHIFSDGVMVSDDEGMELPDLQAARTEAAASARDLALSADRDGFGRESRSIQIADAAGMLIETVPVLGDGKGVRF